jgi:TonB family protein
MRPRATSRPLLLLFAGFLLTCGIRAQTPQTATMLHAPATTPEALTQALVGKTVFLRGFYQEDDLNFDTSGKLVGKGMPGSFTLSCLEITKVHFTKHSVQIEANRLGLHFFGGLPYEDDSKPFEKIKLSKKPVEIEIERPVIEPEKKKKNKKQHESANATQGSGIAVPAGAAKDDDDSAAPAEGARSAETPSPENLAAKKEITGISPDPDTLQKDALKKDTPPAPHHDPRESYVQLSAAIEKIFAPSLDDSVIATLPDYWQIYFATKAGKSRAAALDASIVRPGGNVKAPHLLTVIDPASNDYAPKNNIAGMVLLQTVVGAGGRPSQVIIVRPIGFGLDEKAVEAVQNSHFQAGSQEGKDVATIVNLQVIFRIYSNRTRPQPLPPSEVAPKNSAPVPTHREPGTTITAAKVGE